MRFRTPIVFGLSVLTGLLWSLGSDVQVMIAHFVAFPLIGATVATCWQPFSWRRQFLVLAGFLGIAGLVRVVIYCLRPGGWHSLTTDAATQLSFSASFVLQAIAGLATWCAMKFFMRKAGSTRTLD